MKQLKFFSSNSEIFTSHDVVFCCFVGFLFLAGFFVVVFTHIIVFQTKHLLSLGRASSRGPLK